MKVALCQLEIVWENKSVNEEKAVSFIKQAAEQNVDLILFPEMSLTGFSMNVDATKEWNGVTCSKFQQYAREYSISIGIGWVKANENTDKAENHYTIINRCGVIINDYIKIHPFSYAGEDAYFLSGSQIRSFELDGYCMSSFICYDLRFPEVFRMVPEQVHAIIISANWPAKRSEHWKCLLQARAIENQVYMLGVNCVGDQDGTYYSGDSCVFNPNGEMMKMICDDEGMLVIDLNDNADYFREFFPTRKDRKDYVQIENIKL